MIPTDIHFRWLLSQKVAQYFTLSGDSTSLFFIREIYLDFGELICINKMDWPNVCSTCQLINSVASPHGNLWKRQDEKAATVSKS